MFDHLTKRIVPLLLTFTVSVLLTTQLQSFLHRGSPPVVREGDQLRRSQTGYGSATGESAETPKSPTSVQRGPSSPYMITFQPKARYTDDARTNNVQGAVRLKITLLASGRVGSIIPVTELPYGLTEQAIAAARQIRFEPKTVNGVPVSVVITREYTFTIY
jgi:TonB family protein